MNDFLLFSPPERGAVRAEWTGGENPIERIACASNPEHARGSARLSSLDVRLNRAPKPRSFVWTWYGELLATADTIDLLKSNGLTGFDAHGVITRVNGQAPSRDCLQELVITGWGGLPATAGGVRRVEHCPVCGLSIYSCFRNAECFIDPSQWDGSDFFFVWPAPRFIFVTRRVAEVLKRLRLTGWATKELGTVNCTSQLTPGPLRQWISTKRLEELRCNSDYSVNEFLE